MTKWNANAEDADIANERETQAAKFACYLEIS